MKAARSLDPPHFYLYEQPPAPYPLRLERGAEFLRDHSPVLVLSATREAADDLASVGASPGRAFAGVYRHSLRDLVLAISTVPLLKRGLAPVRRVAREAIAVEITARSRAKLTYLAPVSAFPGFARALARTLEDLRLDGVSVDALRSAGRSDLRAGANCPAPQRIRAVALPDGSRS